MDNTGFDLEIRNLLEAAYQTALLMGSNYTPDQIKLMMVAKNLESAANTFLMADNNPAITLNLKQVALGLLGTQDWIKEGLESERTQG